jgi:glycosyltransferase involved in cell wall biosynthesis
MKKNKDLMPSVSIVIATYNSGRTLESCLLSIKSQEYPKNRVEVILSDGGSTDNTLELGKDYKARIIKVDIRKQGPEYNRAQGAHLAKNEILAFLDHDNVLPHKKWINNMIRPFIEDPKTVGVETLRYHYNKNDVLLGRFFSLFCVNDMLPFYLGKADRLSYLYSKPQEYGVFKKAGVEDKGGYYMVEFNKDFIPTLGSNGFFINRKLLFSQGQVDIDSFFHIDVNVDLIGKGFNRYAFIKDTIVHKTEVRGLIDYLRRRKLFMEGYHLKRISKRRYSVYEKKDFFKLLMFVTFSATFVKPFIDAVRGFIKIRDAAWFLNPIICYLLLVVYSYAIIKGGVKRYAGTIL